MARRIECDECYREISEDEVYFIYGKDLVICDFCDSSIYSDEEPEETNLSRHRVCPGREHP